MAQKLTSFHSLPLFFSFLSPIHPAIFFSASSIREEDLPLSPAPSRPLAVASCPLAVTSLSPRSRPAADPSSILISKVCWSSNLAEVRPRLRGTPPSFPASPWPCSTIFCLSPSRPSVSLWSYQGRVSLTFDSTCPPHHISSHGPFTPRMSL